MYTYKYIVHILLQKKKLPLSLSMFILSFISGRTKKTLLYNIKVEPDIQIYQDEFHLVCYKKNRIEYQIHNIISTPIVKYTHSIVYKKKGYGFKLDNDTFNIYLIYKKNILIFIVTRYRNDSQYIKTIITYTKQKIGVYKINFIYLLKQLDIYNEYISSDFFICDTDDISNLNILYKDTKMVGNVFISAIDEKKFEYRSQREQIYGGNNRDILYKKHVVNRYNNFKKFSYIGTIVLYFNNDIFLSIKKNKIIYWKDGENINEIQTFQTILCIVVFDNIIICGGYKYKKGIISFWRQKTCIHLINLPNPIKKLFIYPEGTLVSQDILGNIGIYR